MSEPDVGDWKRAEDEYHSQVILLARRRQFRKSGTPERLINEFDISGFLEADADAADQSSPRLNNSSRLISNFRMTPNSPDITYTVFPIPVPTADNHVWSYKELRLTSLKLDPEAFSSSYEREAQFTDETWRERVNGTQKVSVVAEITMTGPSHISECPNAYEKSWVGMATTISHQMLVDLKFPFPKSLDGLLIYALNGLWVHPDHRGKALAKRLHQTTIDWVKAHHNYDDAEANQKKVLLALVKADNMAAISLYRTLGYKVIEEEIHPGCWSLTLPVI